MEEEFDAVNCESNGAVNEDSNDVMNEDNNGAVNEDSNGAMNEDNNGAMNEDNNGAVNEDSNDVMNEVHDLKLPWWIIPDQGAGGKGKLLYIEEWGQRQMFRDRSDVFGFWFIGSMSIMLFLLTIRAALDGLWLLSLFLGTICFILFGTHRKSIQLKKMFNMPFALYENGFTTVGASPLHIIVRRERFIPWTWLNETIAPKPGNVIALIYSDRSPGRKPPHVKNMVLRHPELNDPFRVMRLLRQCVPDKTNDSILLYLDENETREEYQGGSDPTFGVRLARWMIVPFLVLFPLISAASLLVVLIGKPSAAYVIVVWEFLFIVIFRLLVMTADEYEQRILVQCEAACSPDGIVIRPSRYGTRIKHVRTHILWSEIAVVRLKLEPQEYRFEGEIETVRGERWRVPYAVYETMRKIPGFKKREYDYFSAAPAPRCDPVVRWDPLRTLRLVLLYHLPVLVVMALAVFDFIL